MAENPVTDPDLLLILEELRPLEPIFHTREFGLTREDFEKRMMPEYWEVGASGRRYSRDYILEFLGRNPPVEAWAAGWQTADHAVRRLGRETYLLTYSLSQGERFTRRSTIWQRREGVWRIVYHQGTIVDEQHETRHAP